ncbi:hypothetical protein M426DRAFT_8988 [Hypoxylon sp. CI-4A]|nr:hypothetical protein M426DRAFT_8988 [Hypoxylon sp. CI-4A]
MAKVGQRRASFKRSVIGFVQAIFALTLFAIFVIAWLVQNETIALPQWAKSWNGVSPALQARYTAALVPAVLVLACLFFGMGLVFMIREQRRNARNSPCGGDEEEAMRESRDGGVGDMRTLSVETEVRGDGAWDENQHATVKKERIPLFRFIPGTLYAAEYPGWFTEYTPFVSEATFWLGGPKLDIRGIGTVILPVKQSPNANGEQANHVITLKNVLHVPKLLFNVIGAPFFEQFPNTTGHFTDPSVAIKDNTGRQIGFFAHNHIHQYALQLSSPPAGPDLGPSRMQYGVNYATAAMWPDSERQRWVEWCAHHNPRTVQGWFTSALERRQGFTDYEKWVRENYRDEFHLMNAYGLDIYDADHRARASAIVRNFMERDEKRQQG